MRDKFDAVVIGVSAGGLKALRILLSGLPGNFPMPIVIVQHRLASSDNYLVTYLDSHCSLTVKEAEEKEQLAAKTVYIAPADYHLLIEKDRTFSLSIDELVCYARPSIDVLFETAAAAYRTGLIGVIMTGANSDGSEGIRSIKAAGGLTIAQDPETSEVSVMPFAAIATGAVDFILPLEEISLFLMDMLEDNHGIASE